jgi:AhpD family alkylhydroperoxidase
MLGDVLPRLGGNSAEDDGMSQHISLRKQLPDAYQALTALHEMVETAAKRVGLDPGLMELVRLRVSQINGCAFCTDLHSRDALKLGEAKRRLYLLPVWRETDLYNQQERAALALAEAMTRLPATQDVPDDVYHDAARAFPEQACAVLAWAVIVINAYNRVGVLGRARLTEGIQQR